MASTLRRGLFVPTVFVIGGFAVLVGLGVWQLDRKGWKEELLAALAARLSALPEALPLPARWPALDQGKDEFRRVSFRAEFQPGQEALVYATASALRSDVKGLGYWVFAPARLADGRVVVVNRGFVPDARKDATSRAPLAGTVEITGILRWPERRGMFTPDDNPRGNVWYARDPAAIAAAKSWGAIPPFYVDMEAPQPPGGLPSVARITTAKLPNNHFHYALTWFALAACLVGVYLFWLFGRRRT